MNIYLFSPLPLDYPIPPHIEEELITIINAADRAKVDVQIEALFPFNKVNILSEIKSYYDLSNIQIIHFQSTIHNGEIMLEDRDGKAEFISAKDFEKLFAGYGPSLLFLSGEYTYRIASQLDFQDSSRKPWIISTMTKLPDEELIGFIEIFYRCLFENGDIFASFNRAISISNNSDWFIQKGTAMIQVHEGLYENKSSVLDTLNWASLVRSLIPREKELIEIKNFLSTNPSPVCWISGTPKSGVTTILQMAVKRFSWMFENNFIYFDLSDCSLRQIEKNLAQKVNKPSSYNFTDSFLTGKILVCLDHFDQCDEIFQRKLLSVFRGLQANSSSKILIGTIPFHDILSIGNPIIHLGKLQEKEASIYIERQLGKEKLDEIHSSSFKINLIPGRLLDLVNDIKNGMGYQELKKLKEQGDPRAGGERQIDRVLPIKGVEEVLYIFSVTGSPVPREIIKNGFNEFWGNTSFLNEFENAVVALRDSQLLQVERIQRKNSLNFEAQFSFAPDIHLLIQRKLISKRNYNKQNLVYTLLLIALRYVESNVISPAFDSSWLSNLVRSALNKDEFALAVKIGLILFDKHNGPFRFVVTTNILQIVNSMFDYAQSLALWDAASYFGLIIGEIEYTSGKLKSSERIFSACLNFNCDNIRKVQFLRALGQISYRKADYSKALDCYEQALEFSVGCKPDILATVIHHKSKALFRLEKLDLAIKGFEEVIKIRESANNISGMLKSQHELARILHKKGEYEKAKNLYLLVITGAYSNDFKSLLAAANYQYSMILLNEGNLNEATKCLNKCKEYAERESDAFWCAHSYLGLAMIFYESGHHEDSASHLQKSLEISKSNNFLQIIEDARSWLINKLKFESSEIDAQSVVPLVKSLFPNMPESKVTKAIRYSTQQERIKSVEVHFDSDSSLRTLQWFPEKGWSCTCDLWKNSSICSHILALHLTSGDVLGRLLFTETNGGNN